MAFLHGARLPRLMPSGCRALRQRWSVAGGLARCAQSRADASMLFPRDAPAAWRVSPQGSPHFNIPGACKCGKSDCHKERAVSDYRGHPLSGLKTPPSDCSDCPLTQAGEKPITMPAILSRLDYTAMRRYAIASGSPDGAVARQNRPAPVSRTIAEPGRVGRGATPQSASAAKPR